MPTTAASLEVDAAVAKARRRLIPFLFLLYIVAYLDRINVGFAALQMNRALGFSATTYSIGAGIFFLGYAVFEVPSNIILARVGARVWIARIMVTWGIVSATMMFVRSAAAFYVLRLLLGLAEAGFFPGMLFYLTRWFPARERARTVAAFMTAVVIAGVIGSPISGALLSVHGAGLAGWQWLFLLEGLPAIALGFVVLAVLPEGPDDAAWLAPAERTALVEQLETEARTTGRTHTIGAALTQKRTWLLAAVYFPISVTIYGIGFWAPQILKNASRASDFEVGLLMAVPYVAGAIAMVLVGRHSDRTGERRGHVAAAALVTATGLVFTTLASGTLASVVSLSIAMAGLASMFGPFWAFATAAVRGVGAAAAIAMINSVGNTGGFVGPYLLGAISDATHSFSAGLLTIAALQLACGCLVLLLRE